MEAARIERPVRLHDLRHSYAAATLAAREPLVFVQKQLGHSDIYTTHRYYGHLERGYLRDAAGRVEAAVWSVTRRDHGPRGGPRLVRARNDKNPAITGFSECAREDLNLHGPYGPQGPQPCASTNSATGAWAEKYSGPLPEPWIPSTGL
jgi:Phage integrase family